MPVPTDDGEKKEKAVDDIFNMIARLPDVGDQFKMLSAICYFAPTLVNEQRCNAWCVEHASFVANKFLKR